MRETSSTGQTQWETFKTALCALLEAQNCEPLTDQDIEDIQFAFGEKISKLPDDTTDEAFKSLVSHVAGGLVYCKSSTRFADLFNKSLADLVASTVSIHSKRELSAMEATVFMSKHPLLFWDIYSDMKDRIKAHGIIHYFKQSAGD